MESSVPPQFPMPLLEIPPYRSKRWSEMFRAQFDDEDPLWSDYLSMAEKFDTRFVDDLNKIVDVILVYVTLFIAVLNTFVMDTKKNFTPDPHDITNQLLNATYHLMAAHYNNNSIPPVIDTDSIFNLSKVDHKSALISNALLYTGIALCTVVSVIALAAKMWLVSYSDRTFNLVGLPVDRSLKRQQAYNGVLAWKMRSVINTMPVILIIAVILFGYYIHTSVLALDKTIGYVVAVIMILGFVLLAITSLAAAFVPECPFYSPFSTVVELVFKCFRKLFPWKSGHRLWLPIALSLGTGAAVASATLKYSENMFPLVFIPLTITFSYAAMDEDEEDKDNLKRRRPQKYSLPHFALGGFVLIGSILAAAGYFTGTQEIFIILYVIGMSILFIGGGVARYLAKSSKKTRVIDAMAWLLNSESTPSKIEPLLQRIGQVTFDKGDEDGYSHYRARLLESLMPLLSSLITSPRTKLLYDPSQLKDLEIYVSFLAHLSDFEDDRFRDWKFLKHLGEDAKSHPVLEDTLRKKLVELIKYSRSDDLTAAAGVVLSKFGFDENGKKFKNGEKFKNEEKFKLPKLFQFSRDVSDTSSITTLTELEPGPPFNGANLKRQSRRKKGYNMLNAV